MLFIPHIIILNDPRLVDIAINIYSEVIYEVDKKIFNKKEKPQEKLSIATANPETGITTKAIFEGNESDITLVNAVIKSLIETKKYMRES